ncbi:MAG: Flp pilus assembly complex ATPase component TadA [Armatimonadota bacterium]|nr:Flp pilus assembly complex ATPase component TadA [Armatimonadota bacterium]
MPENLAPPKDDNDEAPIIRIVNTILVYAIRDKASEIHIEPQGEEVPVSYCIDGVMHTQMKIPTYVLKPVVARIKEMADMDMTKYEPQFGHIHVIMQDKHYDVDVRTSPTELGEAVEKVIMHIAPREAQDDAMPAAPDK